ncbi:hypothetical protein GEMRC1_004167 [Eukaryota sp. GEM-RC1]
MIQLLNLLLKTPSSKHFWTLLLYQLFLAKEIPPQCHSHILSDSCRKLAINCKIMIASLFPTWRRNFLIARELDCPYPQSFVKIYDIEDASIPESLSEWWAQWYEVVKGLYFEASGDFYYRELYLLNFYEKNNQSEEIEAIEITQEFAALVAEYCLRLQSFMENNFHPESFRKLKISPIKKYTPGFITLSDRLIQRMTTLTNKKELKRGPRTTGFERKLHQLKTDPYKFFNKNKEEWPSCSLQSNGKQVMFTFSKKEKRIRTRRTKKEVETCGRKTKIMFRVPQEIGIAPDGVYLKVAIDPNHSNLCGYAWRIENQHPASSGIVLAPKGKTRQPFNFLDTNDSPNVYSANGFLTYLDRIGRGGFHSVTAPINRQLDKSSLMKLRSHRFDFFQRKQRRYQNFVNAIRQAAEGTQGALIWYGRGTDFASRQKVKSANKKFLKFLQTRMNVWNPKGDEFRTSKLTYCCKRVHVKTYFEDGKVDHRHFKCPACEKVWHRDISAALNQLELFDHELRGLPRPLAFQRGQNVVQELIEDEIAEEND